MTPLSVGAHLVGEGEGSVGYKRRSSLEDNQRGQLEVVLSGKGNQHKVVRQNSIGSMCKVCHTKNNKWHQNGGLGAPFIIRKTIPFLALFWCHFPKLHVTKG